MKAWHFTNGNKLRDGSPLPAIGETLRHKGKLIVGQSGLHASKRLIDALDHAQGDLLHRVEVSGAEAQGPSDVLVARERTILWSVNAEPILRDFARRCASDVVHLWDAPKVAVQYLKTGDERLQRAAWGAVGFDWSSAEAALAAVGAALAACSGHRSGDAAGDARASSRASSRAVARDAAARDADRLAAWDATWDASREKQNRRLTSMVVAAYRRTAK